MSAKSENPPIEVTQRGHRLAEAIEHAGGYAALSERSGVPESTVRQYAKGLMDMPVQRLVALAEAAGVSVAWLATGKGQMEPFEGDEFRALNEDARRVVKLITFYNEKFRLGLNPDQLGAAWFKIVNTIADREAAGLDKWDPAPMIELMEKEKGPAEPSREPE
jgi:transcriptional regulator with XRE-family HTH domain